jgi:hypothetical protein
MRNRILVSAAAALAAATSGCDQGQPAENVQRIRVANPHSDRLSALSEPMRYLGLMRAIRDSGKRCQRVESGRYQEDYRGLAMWVALCNDGRHWAIFIAPNADIQVRDCAQMRQLRLPQCRPVAAMPPNPNG